MQVDQEIAQVDKSLEIRRTRLERLRVESDAINSVLKLVEPAKFLQEQQQIQQQIETNEALIKQLEPLKGIETLWEPQEWQARVQELKNRNADLRKYKQQQSKKYTDQLKQIAKNKGLDPKILVTAHDIPACVKALQSRKLRIYEEAQLRTDEMKELMAKRRELVKQKYTLTVMPVGLAEDNIMQQVSPVASPPVVIRNKWDLNLPSAFVKKVMQDSSWERESAKMISVMAFSNTGRALVALDEDGLHKYWKHCRFLVCVEPSCTQPGYSAAERLWTWHLNGEGKMKVDMEKLSKTAPRAVILSHNEDFLLSMVGGAVFLFNLVESKLITILHNGSQTATAVAFHPRDCNILALGLDNGSLVLRDVSKDKRLCETRQHSKRVTSIVFSAQLSYVVSAGADGNMVVMQLDDAGKVAQKVEKKLSLHPTTGLEGMYTDGDEVHMDMHKNGDLLLVSHPNQISVYSLKHLKRLDSWTPMALDRPLSSLQVASAMFAAGGAYVYATLGDGSILVFKTDGLQVICRIVPDTLDSIATGVAVKGLVPHPKPEYSSCMAVAMTDGSVQIWKPSMGPSAKWEDLAAASAAAPPRPVQVGVRTRPASPLTILTPGSTIGKAAASPLPLNPKISPPLPLFPTEPLVSPSLTPGLTLFGSSPNMGRNVYGSSPNAGLNLYPTSNAFVDSRAYEPLQDATALLNSMNIGTLQRAQPLPRPTAAPSAQPTMRPSSSPAYWAAPPKPNARPSNVPAWGRGGNLNAMPLMYDPETGTLKVDNSRVDGKPSKQARKTNNTVTSTVEPSSPFADAAAAANAFASMGDLSDEATKRFGPGFGDTSDAGVGEGTVKGGGATRQRGRFKETKHNEYYKSRDNLAGLIATDTSEDEAPYLSAIFPE